MSMYIFATKKHVIKIVSCIKLIVTILSPLTMTKQRPQRNVSNGIPKYRVGSSSLMNLASNRWSWAEG